jgi:hypothetical protein
MTVPGWTILICGPGATLLILYVFDPVIRRWFEWRAQRRNMLDDLNKINPKGKK